MPVAEFLNPFWRDVWTVFGAVGVAATLFALALTWRQLRKTQTSAQAAADAARRSREAYDRLMLSLAHRAASEAKLLVATEQWLAASLKAADLADLLSQLSEQDDELRELSANMRDSSHSLARVAQGTIKFRGFQTVWPKHLAAVEAPAHRGTPTLQPSPGRIRNDTRRTHRRSDPQAGPSARGPDVSIGPPHSHGIPSCAAVQKLSARHSKSAIRTELRWLVDFLSPPAAPDLVTLQVQRGPYVTQSRGN